MPGLLSVPEIGPSKITPHPYQEEAIDAIESEFGRGIRRTLAVLATGLGKTILSGEYTRRKAMEGHNILFLAHTKDLVRQAVNKLDFMGVEAGVEMGDQFARSYFDPQAVVASKDSMHLDRLATWDPNYFSYIFIDEAHHAAHDNDSYMNILRYFHKAKVIGITATPMRHDGKEMGKVFQSVAYEMNIWDGMTHPDGPYLARLAIHNCPVEVDLTGMKPKRGDFDKAELDARIEPNAITLANVILKEASEWKTLIFAPGVRSAQGLSSAIRSLGLSADWTSGDDPLREQKIQRYYDGDIRYLVGCSIFLEGFDDPPTECVAMFRPTKSVGLMTQMVGRVTRRIPGKKEVGNVLCVKFVVDKDDLAHPIDLLDRTNLREEVLDIAKELAKREPKLDIVELFQKAEEVREQRERDSELVISAKRMNLIYRKVSYDPLSTCDALGIPWNGSRTRTAVISRASEKQVMLLKRLGIEDAPNLSKTRASTILDYAFDRSKRKLATPRQVGWCISLGVRPDAAREMSKKEASEFLSRYFGDSGNAKRPRR